MSVTWEDYLAWEAEGAPDAPDSVPDGASAGWQPAPAGVARSFAKGLLKPLEPPPRLPYPQVPMNEAEAEALQGTQFGEPIDVSPRPGQLSTWMREAYEGIPAPSGWLEQTAYDAGNHAESLLMGAALAPVGGGMFGLGPVGSAAAETAVALGAMGAANYAGEKGASPLAQSGIEVGAAIAVPGLIPRAITRVPTRFGRAPAGAVEAGENVLSYLDEAGYGRQGAQPSDVYEAAISLQGDLPVGTRDPKKYVNQAADRLDEQIELFPDRYARPSLAQSLGGDPLEGTLDLAGFNLNRRELRDVSSSKSLAANVAGRRLETIEYAKEAYKNAAPREASLVTSKLNAQAVLDAADQRAAELWLEVPLDEMPSVDASELVAILDEIDENPLKRRFMPTEGQAIREIVEKYEGKIPYPLLQDLSSSLSMSQRAASLSKRTQETVWRRGSNVKRLQGVVEQMIDSADPGDVETLRAARAATRYAKSIRTPVIEALLESGQEADALKALRQQPDIREAAFETRELLGEDGVASMREAAWREIFGDNIGSRGVVAMRNTLTNPKNEALYEGLFAPEQMEIIRKTIKRHATATRGKAGTAGQAVSTGTGYNLPSLEEIQNIANRNTSTAFGVMASFGRRMYRKAGEATAESLSLEELAGQDIELARMLLKAPTPENLPALQAVWKQALARYRRRLQNPVTARMGAFSAARAADDASGGVDGSVHPDDIKWAESVLKNGEE